MISATIDASVFIASLRSSEPAYAESWACLQAIRKNTVEIICPTLVLPECAAYSSNTRSTIGIRCNISDIEFSAYALDFFNATFSKPRC